MEKDSKTINLVNLIQPPNPPIFQISILLIKQNRIVSRKFILVLHLTTFYSNFTCLKETSAITIEPRISSTTDEAADFNSVRRVMDVYTRHATSTRREERALFTRKKKKKRERERKRRVHRDSKLEGRLESFYTRLKKTILSMLGRSSNLKAKGAKDVSSSVISIVAAPHCQQCNTAPFAQDISFVLSLFFTLPCS